MAAGSRKSRFKESDGLGKLFGDFCLMKAMVNFLMLLVQPTQLTLFCQGMVQRGEGEVLFHIGMAQEHAFEQTAEQVNLGDGPQSRQEALHFIKELAKQGVLSSKRIDNGPHSRKLPHTGGQGNQHADDAIPGVGACVWGWRRMEAEAQSQRSPETVSMPGSGDTYRNPRYLVPRFVHEVRDSLQDRQQLIEAG